MTDSGNNNGGDVRTHTEDVVYLTSAEVGFAYEGCRLRMRRRDGEWGDVRAFRLFPLSEPDRWVSVVGEEGEEKKPVEFGIILDLADLDKDSAEAVRHDLDQRYVVPRIRRFTGNRKRMEMTEWTAETDRGERTFLTRRLRENSNEPQPGWLQITDVEGNRYDIPDMTALDMQSRRWLEEHL